MGLTDADIDRILKLIDSLDYNEVKLEFDDLKLHVRKQAGSSLSPERNVTERAADAPPQRTAALSAPPQLQARAATPAAESLPEGVVVRAPMLGTFYRASGPDAPPYVEVGTEVGSETTVGLVEVMKLFNSIKAGVAGRVIAIVAENGAMVEYNQPLLVIEQVNGNQ